MTDEELKHNLLAPIGVDFEEPGYTLINPDGPAAWDRIEELKAENARLMDTNIRLHKALDVIEGAIHDAKLG